mgnify:CR=1 FL=1
MYAWLKNMLRFLLPKTLLTQYEMPLRKFYANIFYRGSAAVCNICESQFSTFIELPSGDLLCPVCGSLPRNRRLWCLLLDLRLLSGKLLHFSPSRGLYRKLKQNPDLTYISTDFEEEFIADHRIDITNIEYPDETFDTIICFHILEHIPDDAQAMQELYRVLKPGGKVLVQTPFKNGTIYEDASIISEVDRVKHFGQKDHVRIYSAAGLSDRLVNSGFQVQVRQFTEDDFTIQMGLKKDEIILIAEKQ